MNQTHSPDVITLLQEQNKLLTELVSMQKRTDHEEKQRRIIHTIIKMIPYLIITIILIWMYISITSYLASLDAQIGEIKNSVGNVFDTVNDQFTYLKTTMGNFLTSVKSIVPNFSGIFN